MVLDFSNNKKEEDEKVEKLVEELNEPTMNLRKAEEVITADDIFKDIAKLYTKLGDKLWELDRMLRRKK